VTRAAPVPQLLPARGFRAEELSPDELSPDELSPDALSPDALSPDELSPDELSPDELAYPVATPSAAQPFLPRGAFRSSCTACGACVATCPERAISAAPLRPVLNWTLCNGCLECVEVCPRNAVDARSLLALGARALAGGKAEKEDAR